MPQLSVVIITFNEEKNIGRCLESIKDVADDILVLDSFSTDKTALICEKHGARFMQRKWQGYSDTKNFANSQAQYDWVLSLDADEALSEELKNSILLAKHGPVKSFKFKRLTNYCGTWIKHCGWYPDIKVRIFDRRKAKWEGTIHEKLVVEGEEPELLKGDCLHYSYYTVEEHYKQTDKFSSLSAESLYHRGKNASLFKLWLSPIFKFISCYFFKLGFLDGTAGYLVCKIMAFATFSKYDKLRKLHQGKLN